MEKTLMESINEFDLKRIIMTAEKIVRLTPERLQGFSEQDCATNGQLPHKESLEMTRARAKSTRV